MKLAQGQLHRAADLCRQALDVGGSLPPTATALGVLGILHYEWNDLETAASYLQRGIDLCELSGNKEVLVDCLVSSAHLRLGQGDAVAAQGLLDRAQHIADSKGVAPLVHAKIAAGRVALALARHDLATARQFAEQVAGSATASLEHPRIGLAQVAVLLAENRPAEALQLLAPHLTAASRAGLLYVVVESRLLQALAAPVQKDALGYLQEALALAEPEQYIRTFVDKGEPMAALLRLAQLQGIASAYVAELWRQSALTGTSRRPRSSRRCHRPRSSPHQAEGTAWKSHSASARSRCCGCWRMA